MKNKTKIPKYWRSLDELENSSEFQDFVHREFPVAASEFPAGVSRRRWMQLMGASFALASAAGCRWETEKIAPLAERPEGYVPGKTSHYATTIELAGGPKHLVVTCFDERPVKVEGNPDHPASLGATDGYSQAATLSLYDPDRSDSVKQRLKESAERQTWEAFNSYRDELLAKHRGRQGAGLAVLIEPSSSLSFRRALGQLAEAMPEARLYQYAPLDRENELAGNEQALGERVRSHYKLGNVKVLATFDADILCDHPNGVRYARDWASTRELDSENPAEATMSRTYAVESQFSVTGAAADHRAAIKSSDIGWALTQVRDQVRERLAGNTPEEPEGVAKRRALKESHHEAGHNGEDEAAVPPVVASEVLWALADDLVAHQGESLVVVGSRQPPEVHALAMELNSTLGNLGKTVVFTREPQPEVELGTIQQLSAAIDAGDVEALVIVGGNPAYDAPAELAFASKIEKVFESIRLGYHEDETSLVCQWHVPMCHPFEAWGDAVSYGGLPSVAQPLLNPIYQSLSPLEFVAQLAGVSPANPQTLVREAISGVLASPLTDESWKQLLHDGFVDSSIFTSVDPSLAEGLDINLTRTGGDEELVFCPSPTVYDGRFANNGWLQETPDYITKITWDNAAIVSPWTADKLRVKQGEMLRITVGEASVDLPAYVLPGQANGSIGVQLGYGRTAAGSVGGLRIPRFRRYWSLKGEPETIEVGKNVYPLRTTEAMHVATDVKTAPTGETYELATTQDHFAIDRAGLELTAGRIHELVRSAPLEVYQEHPDFAKHVVHEIKTEPLFPVLDFRDTAYAWGMAVDLNKCIGCNACLVACQSENNVPVVGREQVRMGREMHWIRIDRYFHGMPDDFKSEDPASPEVASQMVTCQHCETAPCEEVCPVAATLHSEEGLNDMVYNRCVGTRYCANNCPYKVRRFNYFHMTGYMEQPENQLVQLANNPEVTVRSRGVMEKCTFCVQRLWNARIDAKITGEVIADGEIQTACAQACPTRAIAFGNLNDETSRVRKAHEDPRAYGMLAELDTRPRNMYLGKVSNPHPALAPPVEPMHGAHHEEGGEQHGEEVGPAHDHHDDNPKTGSGNGVTGRWSNSLPIIG